MKTILWETFEITVNIFQSIIIVFFIHSYLGERKSKKFINAHNVLFILFFSTLITFLNKIMLFEGYYVFIYVIAILVHSLKNYKGSILKKLFASVYSITVISLATVVISNLMTVLLNEEQAKMSHEYSLNRFITIVVIQLFSFYILSVSLKILKKETFSLTTVEWIIISVVFCISICISALLNNLALSNMPQIEKAYIALIFLGIIVINVVTFYCFIDLGKKNKTAHENEILKIKEEYYKSFIESAEREYHNLRELRHDTKENYNILHNYIKNGSIKDALEYIEKIYGDLSAKEIFINTSNKAFDAIVNSKFTLAKSFGIECTCIASSVFNGIDEYDMVRLLSNMIENAVTASKTVTSPKIELSVKEEGAKYTFLLKNKIEISVLSDNPLLKTTKKDVANHGFGKNIIRNIADKYNGRCDFYEENGFFCCFVVLIVDQRY